MKTEQAQAIYDDWMNGNRTDAMRAIEKLSKSQLLDLFVVTDNEDFQKFIRDCFESPLMN